MNITLTLKINKQIIQEFAKENQVSEEAVKSDLLYYFHLLQDDKEFFKKEILNRILES